MVSLRTRPKSRDIRCIEPPLRSVARAQTTAMQFSAALATLSHEFQGEARARAFSFWGSVVGIGAALGPVVGGLITQSFGWEWAFYINLPIGATLIGLIIRVIESSRDPDAMQLDLPACGSLCGVLFLSSHALIAV